MLYIYSWVTLQEVFCRNKEIKEVSSLHLTASRNMLIYFFEDSTLACETETSSLSLSKESVCETIKLIPSVKWTQLVSSQAHSVKWPLACETQTSFFKSFKRFLGVKYGGENSSMQKVISGIYYWKATFNIWLHIKSPSYLIPFSSEGWNAQIMFPCCCSPFFFNPSISTTLLKGSCDGCKWCGANSQSQGVCFPNHVCNQIWLSV